ncbi:SRPBCC domain-containing protein [Phenylobacterium sp.]|uniref:SRPBCC domain-containing protein n=1 Tax=Phenylobacterium sp. TaxID=1871053 RepID=UPI0011F81346|nr:SRPBCC domain-containing protein [Phenylobacterium sp.]THD64068.1 MAG: hypothetical protein E8A49_03470 [Phenylobacterium sp.]
MAEALARFIDRYTLEYVWTYPHPIERVWHAIVEPAAFSVWFIPGRLEAKAGGRYWFGDDGFQGAVQASEPPGLLRLADDKQGQVFQYGLSAVAGGTRMQFIHSFPRDGVPQPDPWVARMSDEQRRDLGCEAPGSYPPWRPGAMGGFHAMFDALADHLDGVEPGSRLPATTISAFVHRWATWSGGMDDFTPEEKARRAEVFRSLRDRERWMELIALYRDHVAATLPPA